jgi:opacity protein-like surface antigen
MKKTFLIIAFAVIAGTAFSQEIKFGVGAALGGNTDFGVHARALYELQDKIDIVGGFTLSFPTGITAWQISADAHYKFAEEGDFIFYGLAGFNYSHTKIKGLAGNGKLGFDIGAGTEYKKFFGELKLDTGFGEQVALTIGMYF